ncbi:hypothetical protein CONCODRAFT_72208 [Conidiobolus coronatus NRRL 28638]|uniref:Uncharacterized protein n=1 Tax=Conidiobolus coronatus (strain ATCC 28846 / CBS 209.66 / NRRL 28638) TaxID=796925 RepID=A0A137P094_CONC2|nr:hypothetical protein CONCODRAFT_72208 [Conidiobolus coronatus NRRL 28638]|eukprot:KXN68510.1 hypothetical protein CONCODRAFT_72208 [Conidiobolus coronatus NRRL 28638]
MEKHFKLVEFSKSTYNHNLPDSANKFSISHNDLYLVYKDLPKSIEFFRLDRVDGKSINTSIEFISIDSNFINKYQLKCAVKKNGIGFKYFYPPKNGENYKVGVKILAKFMDDSSCKSFIELMPTNLSISVVTNAKDNTFSRDSSIIEDGMLSQLNGIDDTNKHKTFIDIEKINEELEKANEMLKSTEEANDEGKTMLSFMVNWFNLIELELTKESIEKLLNDSSFVDYMKKVEIILLTQISVNDLKN